MSEQKRQRRWPSWLRRTKTEPLVLCAVLAEPLPMGSADLPYSARFGPGMLTELVGLVSLPVMLLVLWFWIGVTIEPVGWLFITGAIGASLLLGFRNASRNARSVTIDAGGIRAGRLLGDISIPWWEVRGVDAESDASKVRVRGSTNSIVFDLSQQQAAEPRRALIHALRARLEPNGTAIAEWDHRKDGLDRSYRERSISRVAFASSACSYLACNSAARLAFAAPRLVITCETASTCQNEMDALP